MIKKSFAVNAKKFFGYRPGQGLKDFSDELKALSLEDKRELAQLLTDAGMPTIIPVK